MKLKNILKLLAAGAVMAYSVAITPASAATVTEDAGWVDGTIITTADVLDFDFTVGAAGAYLSITDCCASGDTWTIAGDVVGATAVGSTAGLFVFPSGIGAFAGTFDSAWADDSLGHFQTLLGAGSYSITVTGDGGGGLAASMGIRVDAVPLPASAFFLLAGLGGLAVVRRRKT